MCGIFALINNIHIFDKDFIEKQFNKGKRRGQDKSTLTEITDRLTFGFHRLPTNIDDLRGNQPFIFENYKLICNGEIYNYKELYKYMCIDPRTTSDCEIIIHLYKKYGIEHTLQLLDGDFSFILIESDLTYDMHKMIVARDPYGVRPLYMMSHKNPLPFKEFERETIVGFASEIKMLTEFCDELNFPAYLNHQPESHQKPKKTSIQSVETQTETVILPEPEPEKKKRGRKPTKKQEVESSKTAETKSALPVNNPHEKNNIPYGEFSSINGINRGDVNSPQIQYRLQEPLPLSDDLPNYMDNDLNYEVVSFKAGTYSEYYFSVDQCIPYWKLVHDQVRYYSTGFNSIMYHLSPQYNELEIVQNIQRFLIRSIEKRCSTSERPMACLLSGGLDSSIITGLVCQYHKTHGLPQLETYTVGLEGCDDLKYARMVADHLGTKHTEIILKEKDFIDAIPEVINAIETYDTTTVRASIGNYLAGKYIAEHSNARVIFNGDGADELLGGYIYMYIAPDSLEFDKECRRLLKDLYLFDTLRADKCLATHGLESRSPYLDRSFVQYYLTIPPQIRFHTRNEQCEKYLMRVAFCPEYYRNSEDKTLLPDEVLWRTKEAFSDGVSPRNNSLYQIIQEHASSKFVEDNIRLMHLLPYDDNLYKEMSMVDPAMSRIYGYISPKTAEQYLYRKEFEKLFKGMGNIIPYFWMPRYFKNITDPSARTLPIYSGNENGNNYNDDSDDDHSNSDNYNADNDNDDSTYYSKDNGNITNNNAVNTNFNITFNDSKNDGSQDGKPDFTFTINGEGITKTTNSTNNNSSNVHEINIVLDKDHFTNMFNSILQSSSDLKSKLESHILSQNAGINTSTLSSINTPMCLPVQQVTPNTVPENPKPKRTRKSKNDK